MIEDVARGGPDSPELPERFACSTCGRLFSRVANLRQHEAMHDATLQRFACEHCHLTFAWQQTRDRHVLKKHTDRVKRVPCPSCDKLFLPDSLRVSDAGRGVVRGALLRHELIARYIWR